MGVYVQRAFVRCLSLGNLSGGFKSKNRNAEFLTQAVQIFSLLKLFPLLNLDKRNCGLKTFRKLSRLKVAGFGIINKELT